MPPPSDRETVELFHLLFARVFLNGPEKSHCVIKGGCNLRFFFGSVRYSEDMDFDVSRIAPTTLKKNVDKVLSGPLFARILSAQGLSIESVSSPKQTETTQRWKVALRQAKRGSVLHTKIEFSRRQAEGDAGLDGVNPQLVEHYRMPPIVARHYLLPTALVQKVRALAGRTETQARDIFDLSVLFSHAGGKLPQGGVRAPDIEKAVARVMETPYGAFVGQVSSYLTFSERKLFESAETWEAMQLQVVDGLERMRP